MVSVYTFTSRHASKRRHYKHTFSLNISLLSTGQTQRSPVSALSRHPLQKRWPHSVCTGSLMARRHMGHSCLFGSWVTNLAASKPLIIALNSKCAALRLNDNAGSYMTTPCIHALFYPCKLASWGLACRRYMWPLKVAILFIHYNCLLWIIL